jgi:hypothetical protein
MEAALLSNHSPKIKVHPESDGVLEIARVHALADCLSVLLPLKTRTAPRF